MAIFNLMKSSNQNEASTQEAVAQKGGEKSPIETQKKKEDAPLSSESPQCQTVAHITSYPLIRETLNAAEAIPGVRVIKVTTTSLTDPIVGFLLTNGYVRPIVKTFDDFGNQALGTVDSFVPSFKSTGYKEVGEAAKAPFVYADQKVRALIVVSSEAFDDNLLKPSKKMVHGVREYYNKNIYDTKGKPLLRSSVDPIFKPINQTVESFIVTHLPEGEPASKEFSSEIERNFWLTWDLKQRSIPYITGKINDAAMAPCNYMKHALDVYNDNLNKQEKNTIGSSILATYNSSAELVNEAWNRIVVSNWNKFFVQKSKDTDPRTAVDSSIQPVVAEARVPEIKV